jgi:hypothetical protein
MAKGTEISIPLTDFINYARSLPTLAKRQAIVKFLQYWAEVSGNEEMARMAIGEIMGGQMIDPNCMPREFMPQFRSATTAMQLIDIIKAIDTKISTHQENWDWAHVMRVMIDEGIIIVNITPNKFDQLICQMIPGKGRDNVRKNGDFTIIMREQPWTQWTRQSHLNPQEAQDRIICNMIAMEFQPVLRRKIVMEY